MFFIDIKSTCLKLTRLLGKTPNFWLNYWFKIREFYYLCYLSFITGCIHSVLFPGVDQRLHVDDFTDKGQVRSYRYCRCFRDQRRKQIQPQVCVERLIKSESLVGPPNGGSPFDVIAKLSLSPRLLYLTLTRLFGGGRMDSLWIVLISVSVVYFQDNQ